VKCKHCNNPIEDMNSVTYKHITSRGCGQCYQGVYRNYEEIPLDGGVFCSPACLLLYLAKKANAQIVAKKNRSPLDKP